VTDTKAPNFASDALNFHWRENERLATEVAQLRQQLDALIAAHSSGNFAEYVEKVRKDAFWSGKLEASNEWNSVYDKARALLSEVLQGREWIPDEMDDTLQRIDAALAAQSPASEPEKGA
jgi:hypothetical protein